MARTGNSQPVQCESAPPRGLPGFESIRRTWEPLHNMYSARIMPGEYYVSREAEIITTTLGSCISACIRDREAGIGGMNHFMLPDETGPEDGRDRCISTATRYGSFAMEHMINDILSHGGSRQHLEIKLFGGGRIMQALTDIGLRNIAFVRDYLRREGLAVAAEDLGGIHPRRVMYFPQTGRVLMKKMPLQRRKSDAIVIQESHYRESLQQAPVAGDIDLF